MAVLAVPGAVAMGLLFTLRRRVPDPSIYDPTAVPAGPPGHAADGAAVEPPRGWWKEAVGVGLPGDFFRYAVAASLTTGALVTFGIIGYHLTVEGIVPVAAVPLVYAVAMAVEAVAALLVGWVYDRAGARILLLVPVLVALVPALALGSTLAVVVAGVVVWGFAHGVQDSTIKAAVADLVEAPRRATAYGVFAGIQGLLAIVGGAGAGWLYDRSLTALVVAVAVSQVLALALLLSTFRRRALR
jgi:MFS family permease